MCSILCFPSSSSSHFQRAGFRSVGTSPARAKLDIIAHGLNFQVCGLLCSAEARQAWSFVLLGNSMPQKKGYSIIHCLNLDILWEGGFYSLCEGMVGVGPFLGKPLSVSMDLSLFSEMCFTFLDHLYSNFWRRGEAKTVGEDAWAFEKRGSRVPFQES